MRKLLKAFIVFFPVVFAACSSQQGSSGSKLSILVTIVPQKYFVERIAGELAEVSVLIPPGASPAAYELSPSDMRVVSEADVWFTIGVTSENSWYDDFQEINGNLLVVNTLDGIQRLPVNRYGIPGVHGGTGHDHSGGMDPHVWLSPELVKKQLYTISAALTDVDSLNASAYAEGLKAFEEDISLLQEKLHRLLDPRSGSSFMVFHPAWGYFADEFNLVQVPVEIAGNEPSPREMSALVDHGAGIGVSVVFVSPQFSSSSARTIAGELGASVVAIDPLAENWLLNMETVADNLGEALR